MTSSVEAPKEKTQWQILSEREREWLTTEIHRLERNLEQLQMRLSREEAGTIFLTTSPVVTEPLVINDRTTMPDGTNVINIPEYNTTAITPLPNEKVDATKSEIEVITATLIIHQAELEKINHLETGNEDEKQIWIDMVVDQTFKRILDSYPLTNRTRADIAGRRPHRHAQVDNAWSALIVLAIHESLCPAENRARVIEKFIADNKETFKPENWLSAQMMLNQARVLGLIPNGAEEAGLQERQLVFFLQKHVKES